MSLKCYSYSLLDVVNSTGLILIMKLLINIVTGVECYEGYYKFTLNVEMKFINKVCA